MNHRLTLDGVRNYPADPVFDRPLLGAPIETRLAPGVAERRAEVASRRRLTTIWDDRTHTAEKAALLAALSRPKWPILQSLSDRRDGTHRVADSGLAEGGAG